MLRDYVIVELASYFIIASMAQALATWQRNVSMTLQLVLLRGSKFGRASKIAIVIEDLHVHSLQTMARTWLHT
jgi:hypothetical protein